MRSHAAAAGLVIVLVLVGGAGCRSCDHAGCTDRLRVTSQGLRPTQTVEVCVGASCVAANAAEGVTFTDIAQPPSGIVEVWVRVRDGGTLTSEQRQNRPVDDFRPNGGGCPPTCKQVDVVVNENGFA